MFESDDFDQVLSQLEFPDSSLQQNRPECLLDLNISSELPKNNNSLEKEIKAVHNEIHTTNKIPSSLSVNRSLETATHCNVINTQSDLEKSSPKKTKRKMLSSFFDSNSKRKFPGPAGLLVGTLEETSNENVCQMELFSQDVTFSQNNLRDIFQSTLWKMLLDNITSWQLGNVETIRTIKQQALAGNLKQKKAQLVTAFVESVDRSAADPLIVLRDISDNIKCTIHREVWNAFSSYLVAEICALVLIKPTVLTTGAAYKKHYLNVTLSNVYAIYSSAQCSDDSDSHIANGYKIVHKDDLYTVLQANNLNSTDITLGGDEKSIQENILDGLDSSLFLDEIF